MKTKVLLTGITGFLGSHTAIQLLEKGYEVIGTLRSENRIEAIKKVIGKHIKNVDNLKFAVADLNNSHVWDNLMQGVDYVQHIASPFPRTLPKNDDELVVPAKNGVQNILEAAARNKVKRVVLTSSTAAIVYGKEKSKRNGTFNEENWTDENNLKDTTPYFRSKTIAEKLAWDFLKNSQNGLELSVVCPGAILGPVLEEDFGTSANIVIKLLDGSTPALPKIGFDMVDVRSVADLQIKAMETPKAANERFIASAGFLSFAEVANILRSAYPNKKIPKFSMPNFFVKLYANFDKDIKPVLLDLGVERRLNHSKAEKLLGWQPIPVKDAVLSCAESVMELILK